ncbi:hypothetical protein [Streptomyces clavifer]
MGSRLSELGHPLAAVSAEHYRGAVVIGGPEGGGASTSVPAGG